MQGARGRLSKREIGIEKQRGRQTDRKAEG
jgi:hypothetical protein